MVNKKGYTFVEVFVVSVILVMVIAAFAVTFIATKVMVTNGLAGTALQRDADLVAKRMIRGVREPGGIVLGLRTAKSFSLPVSNPAGSRVDYVDTNGNLRSYFLSGASVIYQSPTQSPNQVTLYTAPSNSTITLRFWNPSGYLDNEIMGVYVSIVQTTEAGGKVSGSLSTYVNARNVSK